MNLECIFNLDAIVNPTLPSPRQRHILELVRQVDRFAIGHLSQLLGCDDATTQHELHVLDRERYQISRYADPGCIPIDLLAPREGLHDVVVGVRLTSIGQAVLAMGDRGQAHAKRWRVRHHRA